jgi:hypothetical protein
MEVVPCWTSISTPMFTHNDIDADWSQEPHPLTRLGADIGNIAYEPHI